MKIITNTKQQEEKEMTGKSLKKMMAFVVAIIVCLSFAGYAPATKYVNEPIIYSQLQQFWGGTSGITEVPG